MKERGKKSIKAQVEEKTSELKRKRDSLWYRYGVTCNMITYKQSNMKWVLLADVAVFLIAYTLFGVVVPAVGFTIGSLASCIYSAWSHNRKELELIGAYRTATLSIHFYTHKVLDKICAQITEVDAKTTEAEEAEAKERAKAANEKYFITQQKQQDAKKVHRQFNMLYDIITNELEGTVEEDLQNEVEVWVTLPLESSDCLMYRQYNFPLNGDGLRGLTFLVSRLRPIMEAYHSLQKSLDTAVPAEQ